MRMIVYDCKLAPTCQGCRVYLTDPACPYWMPKPAPSKPYRPRVDPIGNQTADDLDRLHEDELYRIATEEDGSWDGITGRPE
jgi:hypothetical protein